MLKKRSIAQNKSNTKCPPPPPLKPKKKVTVPFYIKTILLMKTYFNRIEFNRLTRRKFEIANKHNQTIDLKKTN